jgi:hypothetical protein
MAPSYERSECGLEGNSIPFPGRRQSFVKIVDVEDYPSFR